LNLSGPEKFPNCGKTPTKLLDIITIKVNKNDRWYVCRGCKYESLNKVFKTWSNCKATTNPDYFDVSIDMGKFICKSCSHKWSSLQYWKDFYKEGD
jgi:hypothetical protein